MGVLQRPEYILNQMEKKIENEFTLGLSGDLYGLQSARGHSILRSCAEPYTPVIQGIKDHNIGNKLASTLGPKPAQPADPPFLLVVSRELKFRL